MRLAFALLSILSTAGIVHASDDPAADYQKADRELNNTFKQIEHRLSDDPGGKSRLVHTQRAWIAFRDAECAFQSSGEDGGSAAPLVIAACRAALTSERAAQLKTYLNCEEGDLACPVPSE
ncbi:lysozyme inhibitor LprI family protein [Aquamicrobium terrae]|uniref:Uncharacterized protein YecT (DUF1311 family) n=1 Tax=Aquamicrobium terrae TaxID=1324945 RepID=A0ABV2N2G1_9HYPH